jgi:hypothetical protein
VEGPPLSVTLTLVNVRLEAAIHIQLIGADDNTLRSMVNVELTVDIHPPRKAYPPYILIPRIVRLAHAGSPVTPFINGEFTL